MKIIGKIKTAIHSTLFVAKLGQHGKHIRIQSRNCFVGLKNVSVGDDFTAKEGLWIEACSNYFGYKYNPTIIIGNNVHLSRNCHIGAINKIEISDNVLIGSNVLINDHSHGETSDFSKPRNQLPLVTKGEIFIGENCFIGDNSVILSGVTLGKNCVVGANSLVNKSFSDNSLIAGNPAKLIKTL